MAEQNQPGEMAKSSPGQADGQEEFWQETAAMSMAEADADKQSMKVAWIGALIFHFLLFITVFPSMGGMAFEAEEREPPDHGHRSSRRRNERRPRMGCRRPAAPGGCAHHREYRGSAWSWVTGR